jgi:hypothetical protein
LLWLKSATAHEGLRPVGEQRFAREGGGEERCGRREQQDAPSAIGEPDQQTEAEKDADEPHRN